MGQHCANITWTYRVGWDASTAQTMEERPLSQAQLIFKLIIPETHLVKNVSIFYCSKNNYATSCVQVDDSVNTNLIWRLKITCEY